MKNKNVLARSSKIKSIGLNNTLQSLSYTLNNATSARAIQVISGVNCRGDCFADNADQFTIFKYTGNELRLNKHGIDLYFRSNVISSVGSLNSVVRNINAINLTVFIYNYKPINITFEDEKIIIIYLDLIQTMIK